MEEALYSATFCQNGGVSFSYRHQTRYINCSNQAGQLTNLHSLATTNRKPAIFFLMSFSGVFFLFFIFLSNFRGFLGALTCSKLLKICTHVGIRGHQDAAEAGTRAWHRGSTAPPGAQSENLMYSSHILARIHMKLGTHIDLIELNKFHTACHRLRPTGSRLFRAV